MEFVMTIGDATIFPNVGFVIVGGNPEITKNGTSGLSRKGERIIVNY